jgi:hypothetical protein
VSAIPYAWAYKNYLDIVCATKNILKKTQINVYAIKMLIIVLKCFILLSSAYITSNLDIRNSTVNMERNPQANEERRHILP